MRVLFLGAGASKRAGYPLGAGLIEAVARHMDGPSQEITAKAKWSHFVSFRQNARDVARLLLSSGNPEVVLSYINGCIEALTAAGNAIRERERKAVMTLRGFPADIDPTAYVAEQSESLQGLHDHLLNSPLRAAQRARSGFIIGMREFFEHRHFLDFDPKNRVKRDYLRRELEFLRDGDVVITTNYDTLVERVLLEDGRWSYTDGYGFPVRLKVGGSDWLPVGPNGASLDQPMSRVRVLKLHGSYGWESIDAQVLPNQDRNHELGGLFLTDGLFQAMPPYDEKGKPMPVCDVRAKPAAYPVTTPVLAHPSYLKTLSVQRVWEEARKSIEAVNEFRVIGASLPQADIGVPTLLNPLRFRLAENRVKVTVCDRGEIACSNWRDHLGPGVKWVKRYAGERRITL